MEENLNLYQKLAKIRKQTEVIQKNKSGFGYKYTSIDTILSYVTAGMNKYGVSLMPRIDQDSTVESYTYSKVNKKTGAEEPVMEFLAKIPITYIWINNDNPEERIEVPWFISGSQADPSQAMGSAMTYGLRYFLTQFFQIATPEDDPDEWRSKQKEAAAAEDKAIAAGIITEIDTKIRSYMADHPDKADEIKKFMSKYAKGGNYLAITDPTLAAKLSEDFTKTYLN